MLKAFITGASGQDASYLAELLLEKGYQVEMGSRRASTANLGRIKHIQDKVKIVDFDLLEPSNMVEVIRNGQYDEFYNLGAMSFVGTSFKQPIMTANIDGLAVTHILEAIRLYSPQTKFYQASTSEMFGKVQEIPQTENTPFYPRSPYGVAKLYAHWIVKNYRESYGLFACSGILFNHESPRRGDEFVTKKITNYVSKLAIQQEPLQLGNLEAKRDWGFAKDYVEAMWLMLQQEQPDDFVIATNETHTVKEFVEEAFRAKNMEIVWKGEGENEIGYHEETNRVLVEVNKDFYRPAEVELLIGDYSKAEKILGWKPKTKFKELVKLMTI